MTGGGGFVGANLVRRLLRDGHAVVAVVRPGSDRWRLAGLAAEVREVELAETAEVERVVEEIRPEWVFHLAAHGAYSSQRDRRRMFRTNVDGVVNLVDACEAVGIEAFVSTGSSSEYGFKNDPPSESTWLEPNSDYAVTKAAATLFCRHAARSRGLPITTLRLYSVYGPYEEPTRFVPTLIAHALRAELPPLVSPDTARDFVHVDDVVEAYLLAARAATRAEGAVYNVGSGVQTTIREAVETARRVLGVTAEARWGTMPGRSWDTTAWVADSRLIRQSLAWRPRLDFGAGLRATADWLEAAPSALRARYGLA